MLGDLLRAGAQQWVDRYASSGRIGEGMRTPHPPTSATTDTPATQDYHHTRAAKLLN